MCENTGPQFAGRCGYSIRSLYVIQSAVCGITPGAPLADSVLIESLVVETVVGVYDWEREVAQVLVLDLEMAWDNRIPGASDDVADALDYASVSALAVQCLKELKPKLLEHGAEVLAERLQREFGIGWLRLTLRKPGAVPAARSVGVCIERSASKGEHGGG
ncbi:MAG: dihydroneopterin aldolase [Marinobacter maritimus]